MKKRMWVLVSILFFLVIAVLLSFWPKEKIITQSASYYDSENDKIGEKKTIIQPNGYRVGDEVNYLKKWLADNQFISNKYFDSNFKNFKIEGKPFLSATEEYNFSSSKLIDDYNLEKNVFTLKTLCESVGSWCRLAIRKEGEKNILQSLSVGVGFSHSTRFDINITDEKRIECQRNDFHDCIIEAIKYYYPNYDIDACFKAGGCIKEEDRKYQVAGVEELVDSFENFKFNKVVKPRMSIRFDVALNGESLCSGCYTSDGYGPYSVTFEIDDSNLKIIGLSSPLKEYSLKINRAQASKIFKSDKDCKKFNKIYLYADDGYWYPDTLEYEKHGLHWQVNAGDGYCGRECIIDATNGQLLKGANHCV